jgi:hypothetical protein
MSRLRRFNSDVLTNILKRLDPTSWEKVSSMMELEESWPDWQELKQALRDTQRMVYWPDHVEKTKKMIKKHIEEANWMKTEKDDHHIKLIETLQILMDSHHTLLSTPNPKLHAQIKELEDIHTPMLWSDIEIGRYLRRLDFIVLKENFLHETFLFIFNNKLNSIEPEITTDHDQHGFSIQFKFTDHVCCKAKSNKLYTKLIVDILYLLGFDMSEFGVKFTQVVETKHEVTVTAHGIWQPSFPLYSQ